MGCNESKVETNTEEAAVGEAPAGAEAEASNENLEFLKKVRLFQRLPEEEHPALANAMQQQTFESGKVIIQQGDEGNDFFVIKSGECTVEVDGAQVANLKAGDFFGEASLLRDEARTATIKATGAVEALTINRAQFENLGLNQKLEFPKRGAVGGGAGAGAEKKPPSSKTAAEEKLMTEALKNNKNLQESVGLDDAKIKAMIKVMWKEDVAAGHEIIKQGDLEANYFYIVTEGEFEVKRKEEGQSAADAASASVGTLGKGSSFGELALMYFAPRAATVVAKGAAKVMIIDREQFKSILAASSEDITKRYVGYLNKVDVLAPLKDTEKADLAKALSEMTFSKDESIFEQGEKGDQFYILIDGSVKVVKSGKVAANLTATEKAAQYFGEQALLTNEARSATITVTSDTAKALIVDKVTFEMLLGPLQDLKKRGKNGKAEVKKVALAGADSGKRFGNIVRKDLKRLGLLGCGGFGAVEMVEHVKTLETYALKALSKGYVVKSGMQSSVMSEKNVQLMCDSTFVVKLYETFNGDQMLYLLLELALGGELYATYNKKSLWGKEDCAKYYVAGTVFAFEHLHGKKIIFRDLKPENLLLNELGHVKLTDMGLAKVVVGKTYTTCGTPDYFAPELIASKGHTSAVDWWTLGILCFELLGGHPPFESATPMQIYQKVTKGINRVQFPRKVKGNAEALIKSLCAQVPSDRLPMKKGGTENIKKHPYFSGFDWDRMFELKVTPPYKPTVKSKKDAGNFTARKEDMPPQIPYKNDGSGWDKDFATST